MILPLKEGTAHDPFVLKVDATRKKDTQNIHVFKMHFSSKPYEKIFS